MYTTESIDGCRREFLNLFWLTYVGAHSEDLDPVFSDGCRSLFQGVVLHIGQDDGQSISCKGMGKSQPNPAPSPSDHSHLSTFESHSLPPQSRRSYRCPDDRGSANKSSFVSSAHRGYGDDMSRMDEVGERDGWRCWLCDKPVDPQMSVNDPRGPSVDAIITKAKSKSKGAVEERLAHRGCNTRKGAVAAVAPWPDHLFVVDSAPLVETTETLKRKGGRMVVGRCPTRADGEEAAAWLTDRLSRLAPDLDLQATVEPGGGQFMVVLQS